MLPGQSKLIGTGGVSNSVIGPYQPVLDGVYKGKQRISAAQ